MTAKQPNWTAGTATVAEAEAYAEFLTMIKTPAKRTQWTQNPEAALGQPYYSNLPPELRGFLEGLSVEELGLLYRLCRTTRGAGLYVTHGRKTVCHL
jgi:hypothetical protein